MQRERERVVFDGNRQAVLLPAEIDWLGRGGRKSLGQSDRQPAGHARLIPHAERRPLVYAVWIGAEGRHERARPGNA